MANNTPANLYCDRRPMTRKEIKFFGTAVSFDEEMATKTAAKNSPKFMRTQSFGMLSPKPGRKLFRSRDKNSNYNYSVSGSANSLSSLSECVNSERIRIEKGGCQSMGKLKLVQESVEVDNCQEECDLVLLGAQRLERRNRLKRMRMHRMRSRSASTDSWDDPDDKR